jgi:hypothetical protein
MDVNDELSQELALLRHVGNRAIEEGIKERRSADGKRPLPANGSTASSKKESGNTTRKIGRD